MERETQILNKELFLPSSLLNDIEFDELDKELQSKEVKENNEINGSNIIPKK